MGRELSSNLWQASSHYSLRGFQKSVSVMGSIGLIAPSLSRRRVGRRGNPNCSVGWVGILSFIRAGFFRFIAGTGGAGQAVGWLASRTFRTIVLKDVFRPPFASKPATTGAIILQSSSAEGLCAGRFTRHLCTNWIKCSLYGCPNISSPYDSRGPELIHRAGSGWSVVVVWEEFWWIQGAGWGNIGASPLEKLPPAQYLVHRWKLQLPEHLPLFRDSLLNGSTAPEPENRVYLAVDCFLSIVW